MSSVWNTSRGIIGRTRISPLAVYFGTVKIQMTAIAGPAKSTKTASIVHLYLKARKSENRFMAAPFAGPTH